MTSSHNMYLTYVPYLLFFETGSGNRMSAILSKGALHSQYAVRKRTDFRWRLNVDNCMKSFSSVGRRFHARGAAIENAQSPICCAVLGWKRSPLLEACSEERDGMFVTSMMVIECTSSTYMAFRRQLKTLLFKSSFEDRT